MFKVRIDNIDALYTLTGINTRGNGRYLGDLKLGDLELQDLPLSLLETRMSSDGVTYRVRTTACVLPIGNQGLPFRELQTYLPKYGVRDASATQVLLSKDGLEFMLKVQTIGSWHHISVSAPCSTRPVFNRTLQDYVEILEAYGRIMLGEKTNILFILGQDVSAPRLAAELTDTTTGQEIRPIENKIALNGGQVSFSQIGGCRSGKEAMLGIYDDIVHPERAKYLGRDPEQHKGYLLLGEPGNGKTLLVRALATKLREQLADKVRVYAINYSNITSIFRGGEALATAQVFDLVALNEQRGLKTLLFFDELHAIANRKSQSNEALDTLLARLGGAVQYKGLTVIGATSEPAESLDPALIRPERFGTRIRINKPDEAERVEILEIYINRARTLAEQAGNKQLFGQLDTAKLAKATGDFTGAELAAVVQRALSAQEEEIKATIGRDASDEAFFAAYQPITMKQLLDAVSRPARKRIIGLTAGLTGDFRKE